MKNIFEGFLIIIIIIIIFKLKNAFASRGSPGGNFKRVFPFQQQLNAQLLRQMATRSKSSEKILKMPQKQEKKKLCLNQTQAPFFANFFAPGFAGLLRWDFHNVRLWARPNANEFQPHLA